MSRRQQKRQSTRTAILEAAARLFAAQGLPATSTREIAAAAGVSYQTLYNHFPSKAAVVSGIINRGATDLAAHVDAIVKQYDGDLLERLALVNRARLQRISEQDRALWQALVRGAETPVERLDSAGHERYHALLSLAQGVGELRDDVDLHLLAHTLDILGEHAVNQYTALAEVQRESILRTLEQQTAQLVAPYLAGGQVEASDRSVRGAG